MMPPTNVVERSVKNIILDVRIGRDVWKRIDVFNSRLGTTRFLDDVSLSRVLSSISLGLWKKMHHTFCVIRRTRSILWWEYSSWAPLATFMACLASRESCPIRPKAKRHVDVVLVIVPAGNPAQLVKTIAIPQEDISESIASSQGRRISERIPCAPCSDANGAQWTVWAPNVSCNVNSTPT